MIINSVIKGICIAVILTALVMITPSGALATNAKDSMNTETMQSLEAKVTEALKGYDDVKIDVKEENVLLRGHVKTQKEKDTLESKIRSVPGVKYVHDAVTVLQEESNAVEDFLDDTAITAEVKGKLLARKGLDSLDITVNTADGVLTLSGKVESVAQVELAEKTAREVKGVKKIINALTVQK